MNNLYFSVIIPSFNGIFYLKKSINSVLNQTYKMFEIIVIDNNSTDGSQNYIKSLKSSNIKLLITDNYGSIAKSRNIGIENASGNWISFLDSDDYWHPDKLKLVADKIIDENPDMVSHDKFIVDTKDRTIITNKYNNKLIKKDILKYLISKRNLYSTSTISVRKEFLKINNLFFDERLVLATVEDYDFWIRLTMKNAKVANLKSRLAYYRIHKNNASKNNIKHIKAALFVKKKSLKYILENQLFNFKDLLEITFFYYLYFFYVNIKNLSYKIFRI
tara:strand:- start:307 stop:1131 length:825 start_codon:yes stop_codon:yes gene_type:complete